ncbi:hypothetical protein DESPIG_02530 [Desulfovibrio piger ATCC 29098]|uniref:Uncharacterized protein n=1 Tax=Desulfovibrio piger ATCC 29098 TaxID=411464 RepID=B6WWR1_9BACT|nr:hypothetical protein DESPIG_02530 [Desulfovibrio piger ATCC 29098]
MQDVKKEERCGASLFFYASCAGRERWFPARPAGVAVRAG